MALGPAGCIAPGCPQDLRAAGNRALLAESGTRWVRLWADWPTLMPAPGTFAADRVAALDDQLATARADGLRTILTFYRTPDWVGRGVAAAPPWQAFVAWAIGRYGASLDVLELCNEPNLQGTAPETVAAMFVTAQRIASDLASPLVLAGPATSDVRGYDRFTDRLLDALDARGFVAGPAVRVDAPQLRRRGLRHQSHGRRPAAPRRALGRLAGGRRRRPADPRDRGRRDAAHDRAAPGHRRPGRPARQAGRAGDRGLRAARRPRGRRRGARDAVPLPHRPALRQRAVRDRGAGGARRPAFEAWRALPSVA